MSVYDTPTFTNLDAEFQVRLKALLEEGGPKIWLNYGWRSYAEQKRLYDGWVARKPGFFPANRPGTSLHEKGLAADVNHPASQKLWFSALARKHGFRQPFLVKEPWHLELDPARSELKFDKPTLKEALLPEEEEDMARYADQITWPDGAKTQVLPDGAVKCFGAPFHGSMHDLKPEQKLSFTRADAITANDPADKTKGYTIWNENGDAYRFPVS